MGLFVDRLMKQLLSGLPADWRVVHVDDVAQRGTGHTPDRDVPEYWDGGIKWVSLADSHRLDRVFIKKTTHSISEAGIRHSSAVRHPAGTVILSRDAGVGMSAIMRCEMAVSQHFIAWQCADELENLYLYYWLQFMKPEFERQAVGSTIKTIGFAYFDRLEMILPPLSEQKTIANVLWQCDRARLAIDRMVQAKRRALTWVMQQLLSGRRRLPAFAGEPWGEVHIGDVLAECDRPVDWNDDEVYDLVSVRRWAGGVYTRDQLAGRDIKVKKLKRIRSGDILISHIQSAYGAMAIVQDDHDGHCVSELYTVLIPKDPAAFERRFFASMCRRKWMWHQAYVASNGFLAERLRINFDPPSFLKRPISIPRSVDEQQAIADVLDTAQQEIDVLRQLGEQIQKQQRGLMQKLLTGQIRVKETVHG